MHSYSFLNGSFIFFLNYRFSFGLSFLGDVEKHVLKLCTVTACLKLDDAPYPKNIDLVLPEPPSTVLCPNAKVAKVLSSLLGEGCFSKSIQLPHNYYIGMGLYMISSVLFHFSLCLTKD